MQYPSKRRYQYLGAVFILLVVAVMALAPMSVLAQTTGTMNCRVEDETAGALPGCTITVVNEATGLSQTVVTNPMGRHQVLGLHS